MDEKELKRLRADSRAAKMAHEKQHGKARAATWSGKPEKDQKVQFRKKDRRKSKAKLNKSGFEDRLNSALTFLD